MQTNPPITKNKNKLGFGCLTRSLHQKGSTTMTTKKTPSDQATEQQLHRQQQKEAKEKQSQKKLLAK